jgi:hypothetical protein
LDKENEALRSVADEPPKQHACGRSPWRGLRSRASLPLVSLRRGSCGRALLLALLALARPSRAQQPPAYELDYVADPGCPGRDAFAARVQAQLAEAGETTPGTPAHASVRLRRDAAGATGSLELRRDDGTRHARELSAESCDAAAQGLAFVLAYALGGGEPERAPASQSQGQTVPNALPPPPPTQVPLSAPVASAERPKRAGSTWHYGLAVELGARTGLGPNWTLVELAELELRRTGQGALEPTLRAGFAHGEPATQLERVASARFSWLAARVEGCPVQLHVVGTLQLLACGGAHLGRLSAVGQPSSGARGQGRSADQVWADVLGGSRLGLVLLRVLVLEARGEVVVPLTQYRFAFDNPDTSVYQVPGVAFAGFVGLGVHFP